MSAASGAGEHLRWCVHEMNPDDQLVLNPEPTSEGMIQLMAGSCRVRLGSSIGVDSGTVLWRQGDAKIELLAEEPARLLEVWVPGHSAQPLVRAVRWDDVPTERLNDSLVGRSVAGGLVAAWLFDVPAGYDSGVLEHPEEQISSSLRGEFTMFVSDEQIAMKPHRVTYVRGATPHGGRFSAGEVTLLEVFAPKREGEKTVSVGVVDE
jgi:hypothetical protein